MKKLVRSLNLTSVIAISIGGMLGSGIFVLPGIAASKTGPSLWLAYLLAAIFIIPAALSKSELASAMPSSGGTYVYIERTFGPLLGTISGIGLWLSLLLKSAFALVGFGAYLSVFTGAGIDYTKYIAIFFLFLIMMLNIYGIKKVGKVQIFIVSISITGLILLLFFGFPNIDTDLMKPTFTHGSYGLLSTVAFVYISYAGVTKVAAIAGEIKNPGRNLPLSMLLSLFIMAVLYVSIAFVLVGNIPMEELSTDIKPIYTLASRLGGESIGYAAAVLGIITLVSMANSGVLAASRFPFAMARDKLFPDIMSKIHPEKFTPYITIFFTSFAMAITILYLDVERIAKLASAFMVFSFILVNLSVLILRETAVQWYHPTFRSPLYPYIQLFGIITGILLLILLGLLPFLSIFAVILLGIIIYSIYGFKASRIGVLKQYGHRPAMYLLYKKDRKKRRKKMGSTFDRSKSSQNREIISEAGSVVALLGNERSAEMLTEIGAAINNKNKTLTLNITEIPNQTFMDVVMEEDSHIASLKRRVQRLAEVKGLDIDFECVVTHNLSQTIYELSNQANCDWLVLSWKGKDYNGILVNNPIGWLMTHINSNVALFKDNGVRYISRVLLAMRPGKKDKKFVKIVDRICQFYNSSFTLLHVLPENMSDDEMEEIKKNSENIVAKVPSDGEVVILKSNDSIKTISEISAEYDLLVIGTPVKDSWLDLLFGTGKDKFAESSACSVLRLTMKDL